MKRIICMILIFCLLLSGCSLTGDWIKEPVKFYYVRENYQKDMEQVIGSEIREASGHKEDLPYLLALYSMGPSSEELRSPLPKNTTITLTERTNYSVELTLSENAQTMTDADFTLSSTCMALTCMEMSQVQQVIVICGDRNIILRKDNMMLYSSIPEEPQEETN